MARTIDLKTPFEFHAIARRADGSSRPFRCYITEPLYDKGGIYYCHIDCPQFSQRKSRLIFGVDPEHARN